MQPTDLPRAFGRIVVAVLWWGALPLELPGAALPASPAALSNPKPEAARAEFMARFLSALRQFRLQNLDGATAALDDAETIQPGRAEAKYLRGLIALRKRDFNEAETAFRHATALDPTLWTAQESFADLPFLYQNFGVARARNEALLQQTKLPAQKQDRELIAFKIFLTYLLEGRKAAAQARLAKFAPSSGARIYAEAALAFYEGNFLRGGKILQRGRPGIPPRVDSAYAGVLAKTGWGPAYYAAANSLAPARTVIR